MTLSIQNQSAYLAFLNINLAPNTYFLGLSEDNDSVQKIIETPFLADALPDCEHRLYLKSILS